MRIRSDRRSRRLGGALALMCLAGCDGAIGDALGGASGAAGSAAGRASDNASGQSARGPGGGQYAGVMINAQGVAVPCDALPANAGITPLRRLTRIEYNNSVRDLLGDTTHPADAFPSDDSPGGFESNNAAPVTGVAVEDFLSVAEQLTAALDVAKLAPCASGNGGEEACARAFVAKFGRRAYRRDLSTDEATRLLGVYQEKRTRADYAGGVRLVVEAIIQAPAFLYRPEIGDGMSKASSTTGVVPLTGFELASRLSYFLWSSTPDDALLSDAATGAILSDAVLETQAYRMLSDSRLSDGVRNFHRQWLKSSRLEMSSKDEGLYPAFTPALKDSMRRETELFVDDLFRNRGASFSTLLTASYSFVDAPLATLYGATAPSGDTFEKMELPAGQRSGVLTQGALLATLALPDQASPIHRGKFIREGMFCQPIPPPPKGVNLTPPKVDRTLPTKKRFEQHRSDPTCSSCHTLMDPIGFGFEHYDAIGRWQTMDGDFPVDSVGEITGTSDMNGTFDGVLALGKKLAASAQVQQCVGRQWMRFALGRTETSDETCAVQAVAAKFAAAKLDIRELMVGVVLTDAFRNRRIAMGP